MIIIAAIMSATKKDRDGALDRSALEQALQSLAVRLDALEAKPVDLVVCGGSALILSGLIARTTRDVDVVALMRDGVLSSPDPLPADLDQAVREVAEDLGLSPDWLNNRPSRGEGGLFQMGLPAGFADRLRCTRYGDGLAVRAIGRTDQVHFKLYAAADRGGYHITDLMALDPSAEELVVAARWAMTHDVSEEFAAVLRKLLRELGHEGAADQL
jgi:hypothetical protein